MIDKVWLSDFFSCEQAQGMADGLEHHADKLRREMSLLIDAPINVEQLHLAQELLGHARKCLEVSTILHARIAEISKLEVTDVPY